MDPIAKAHQSYGQHLLPGCSGAVPCGNSPSGNGQGKTSVQASQAMFVHVHYKFVSMNIVGCRDLL